MARTTPRARFVGAWVRGMSTHPGVAEALIAALLGLSWAIAYAIGGANVAAPHWFYVPIALAASRFGHRGAALTSLGAAILSGPLLPADVAAGVAQTPTDWGTRAAFFIAMGQFLAWLIDSHTRAQRDLQATRQKVSLLQGILDRENGDRAGARSVVHSIEEVLSAGGPDIVFQPIVDVRDGTVHGVEALSRFDLEPRRGPDYWFEAAWKTGLGLELELAALRSALDRPRPCRTACSWR
jgi:diguanylate cyclase